MRTRLQLSGRQAQALRDLADRRKVSVAELIRQAVDEYLRLAGTIDRERKRRALAVAGRFHSRQGDLSVDHDRHPAQTFGE